MRGARRYMGNRQPMDRKDEIKKIWGECFDDPREYVEMYFSRVYSERDALALERGGKIVSSLLLQPYSMKFQHAEVTIGYIAGAATRRHSRGNGYMSALMLEALDTAVTRGMMACALIPAKPWLYFFYSKFDFSTVFFTDNQRYTSLHAFTPEGIYHPVEDPYDPAVYSAFHSFELARQCSVLHSSRDFLNILDDLAYCGGTFVAVTDATGSVAGMAMGVVEDGRLIVKDLLGLDEDGMLGALHALRKHYPDTPVTILAAPDVRSKRQLTPRGMIRIVNTPLCLGIIAASTPDLSLAVRVTDNLLPANSHTYLLRGGNCTIDDSYSGSPLDFDIDADTLNRIVFSSPRIGDILGFPSERPHISLMLD